ncbi:MAG: zeta toxin family protein [Ignavibacteria bacterium]
MKRIDKLISEIVDFAFETTLSSKSIVEIISKARLAGYTINILFFYLNNYKIACGRVAERVKHGGHNIAKEIIKRRYFRGLKNLINIIKIFAIIV